jgi:3-dehydroquinate synthase
MIRKSPRRVTVLSYQSRADTSRIITAHEPAGATFGFDARQQPLSIDTIADPIRIDVTTGSRVSPIVIGEGAGRRLGPLLDQHGVGPRRFVVSNPVVWKLHGECVQGALGGVDPILIPDGERHKTLQSVSRIYEALIRGGADRGSALIAVGGGVVGDTAGFAAATFLRGITLVHVPTTLLGQVDSSIGGKVGVNHPLGKNLIGAFHQPALVVIDPSVLGTLPRREFRSGLYEVVKYGVIASRELFDRIRADIKPVFARDPRALCPIIVECCRIKADVVSKDERESGPRRTLNFGHTVGHALEAVTQYRRFRHGEAIALGMLAAADLGASRGALAERERTALAQMVAKLGPLPPVADLSVADVIEAIRRDKKVVDGRLHFVIAIQIGATMTVDDVTEDELQASLSRIGLKGQEGMP